MARHNRIQYGAPNHSHRATVRPGDQDTTHARSFRSPAGVIQRAAAPPTVRTGK